MLRSVFEHPNPQSILQDQARLFSVLMHEDEHLEGSSLEVQRLAEKLGIRRDPLPSDIDAVIESHPSSQFQKLEAVPQSESEIDRDFIRAALRLRPDGPLDPASARRADLLLESSRIPLQKLQLKKEIDSTHEFLLWCPHFNNDYARFFETARDWDSQRIPAGLRDLVGQTVEAVDKGQLSREQAGLKIYDSGLEHEAALEQRRDSLPDYPNWPHEGEAFAVERQAYRVFTQGLSFSRGPGLTVPNWYEINGAGAQSVRRFLSG
jgi:hypothetical protein